MSVPSAPGDETRRDRRAAAAARAAADPLVSHGFRAGPKCGLVVDRAAGELVRVELADDRPRRPRAGARRRSRRASATLSREDLRRGRRRVPATSITSLTATGTPWSGPRSARRARRPPRAPRRRARDEGVEAASSSLDPREAPATASRGESSPLRIRLASGEVTRLRGQVEAGRRRLGGSASSISRSAGRIASRNAGTPRDPRRSARRPAARGRGAHRATVRG